MRQLIEQFDTLNVDNRQEVEGTRQQNNDSFLTNGLKLAKQHFQAIHGLNKKKMSISEFSCGFKLESFIFKPLLNKSKYILKTIIFNEIFWDKSL